MQTGTTVLTPTYILVDRERVSVRSFWPDAPETLIVGVWDEEYGESWLYAADGSGGLDCCTADYPTLAVLS
jgi:hypothetical protein